MHMTSDGVRGRPCRSPLHAGPMWLLLLILVSLLCVQTVGGGDVAEELLRMQYRSRQRVRGSDCSIDCTGQSTRPVCGTDELTYPNKCHVRKARKCEGKPALQVASKGRCKASRRPRPPVRTSCSRERAEAAAGAYVPTCNPDDDTFTALQCYNYKQSETCWCVTDDGKPITGSFMTPGEVDCAAFLKDKVRRRNIDQNGGKTRRGLAVEGCSKVERAKFNHNLITLFTQEFSRIPAANTSAELLETPERRVIAWKFNQLDENGDDLLRRSEIRALKRMAKKHVKPKSCARKFDRLCDIDQNRKITRQEWSVCLGIDINNDEGARRVAVGGRSGPSSSAHQYFLNLRGRGRQSGSRRSAARRGSAPFGLKPSTGHGQKDKASNEQLDPRKRGCSSERQQALEADRQNPDGRIFIPECADSGGDMYKRVQCHSAGYCWCVNQSSGSPMPGPATYNEQPDCDNIRIRKFKGCPYTTKKQFLQELLDQLSIEMAEYEANNTGASHVEPNPDHTLEERAVRWKMRRLDKNLNMMLERRELKQFKKDIRKKRNLRKCSRNFLRYCDEDNDKKVSMDEWIECTGIDEQKNRPGVNTRTGENPLGRYLKSY